MSEPDREQPATRAALERLVGTDASSIAFARLAEVYRLDGRFDEAVRIARAGLAHHPGHSSGRVTLGRALVQIGQTEEGRRELETVLANAPGNLTALRALAEVSTGPAALAGLIDQYRIAMASSNPELDWAADALSQRVAPRTGTPSSSGSVDDAPNRRPAAPALVSMPDRDVARALRTIGALERWLSALHVPGTLRSA